MEILATFYEDLFHYLDQGENSKVGTTLLEESLVCTSVGPWKFSCDELCP